MCMCHAHVCGVSEVRVCFVQHACVCVYCAVGSVWGARAGSRPRLRRGEPTAPLPLCPSWQGCGPSTAEGWLLPLPGPAGSWGCEQTLREVLWSSRAHRAGHVRAAGCWRGLRAPCVSPVPCRVTSHCPLLTSWFCEDLAASAGLHHWGVRDFGGRAHVASSPPRHPLLSASLIL